MEAKAKEVAAAEGKFTDQVEARNKGKSFVDEMEIKAAEIGRSEGKVRDRYRCYVLALGIRRSHVRCLTF